MSYNKIRRLEILQDKHRAYISVPEFVQLLGLKKTSVSLRIAHGRSLATGFEDMILFSGSVSIDFCFKKGNRRVVLSTESTQQFLNLLYKHFPKTRFTWTPKEHLMQVDLFEDCQTTVDIACKKFLQQFAKCLKIPTKQLTAQNQWQMVVY